MNNYDNFVNLSRPNYCIYEQTITWLSADFGLLHLAPLFASI